MAAPSRHLDCAATLWKSLIHFQNSVVWPDILNIPQATFLETVQVIKTRRREKSFKGVQPSFSRTWTGYCSSPSLPCCCVGGSLADNIRSLTEMTQFKSILYYTRTTLIYCSEQFMQQKTLSLRSMNTCTCLELIYGQQTKMWVFDFLTWSQVGVTTLGPSLCRTFSFVFTWGNCGQSVGWVVQLFHFYPWQKFGRRVGWWVGGGYAVGLSMAYRLAGSRPTFVLHLLMTFSSLMSPYTLVCLNLNLFNSHVLCVRSFPFLP